MIPQTTTTSILNLIKLSSVRRSSLKRPKRLIRPSLRGWKLFTLTLKASFKRKLSSSKPSTRWTLKPELKFKLTYLKSRLRQTLTKQRLRCQLSMTISPPRRRESSISYLTQILILGGWAQQSSHLVDSKMKDHQPANIWVVSKIFLTLSTSSSSRMIPEHSLSPRQSSSKCGTRTRQLKSKIRPRSWSKVEDLTWLTVDGAALMRQRQPMTRWSTTSWSGNSGFTRPLSITQRCLGKSTL